MTTENADMAGTGNTVRYIGDDRVWSGELAGRLRDRAVRVECYGRLEDLQRALDTPWRPGDRQTAAQRCAAMLQRYAPVLLDWTADEQHLADALAQLRAWDAGIPLILIAERPTLLQISLARLHGVDWYFRKPLTDMHPLLRAIEAAWNKARHWQRALELAGREPEQFASAGARDKGAQA